MIIINLSVFFSIFIAFWIVNRVAAIWANERVMKIALFASIGLPLVLTFGFFASFAINWGGSPFSDPKSVVILLQVGIPAAMLAGAAAKIAHLGAMRRRKRVLHA